MIRVRDLKPRHTIVVRCLPCARTARIQPRELGHLRDRERRVLSLAFRCEVCRRRAWPMAVQLADAGGGFVDVDWNDAPAIDADIRDPDARRVTSAARLSEEAHGLRRPFGVGRPRSPQT